MPSGMDSCLTVHAITRCPEGAVDVPYRPRNGGVPDEKSELYWDETGVLRRASATEEQRRKSLTKITRAA